MTIFVLVLATLLAAVWLVQLQSARKEDWLAAAYNQILDNRQEIEKLRKKDRENAEKLAQYHGAAAKVMGLFLGGDSKKEMKQLQKSNAAIQQGDFRKVGVLDLPGYALQRRFNAIGKSEFHKQLLERCRELYGKKYAENRAQQLLARLLSYPMIGVALSLALGALLFGAGNTNGGLAVMGIGTALVLVLVYAVYDEVGDKLSRRRAAISRQFPNVVSKLALLVTSGMIMDRAWRETAESQDAELYLEMRRTAEEMANSVSPFAAYSNFIDRCNTKETTKLASALIQSQSKGNAEIGRLLKDMAHEAWQERRHTAKRDSDKANSKLMIPTMLLFLAILVMIMVPVAVSFTSL